MAAETKSVTAWGKCNVESGATGANGALSTTLEDVGKIKEGTTKLEIEGGGSEKLYGEGHELLDQMELEGNFKLSFTLVKASLEAIAKMYGVSISVDELGLATTVVTEERSYIVTPKLLGAIGAKLPKCSTSIKPIFGTKEGWTIEITATSLVPETGAVCTLFKKKAA